MTFFSRFSAILLVALISLQARAPAQELLWSETSGGQYNENGYAGCKTPDGGFMLLGATYSYGAGDFDLYLVKIDSLGDAIIDLTYGGTGTDYGHDIIPVPDGGYLLVGRTRSMGNGKMDVYAVRIDEAGGIIWQKTYGGLENDEGWAVTTTPDGGFAIGGTTYSSGAGYSDVYLLKINSVGDSLWSRTYGGPGGDLGYDLRTLPDGGFIITGTTGSFGTGYSSMYVIKTDSNGDTLWTTTYGGDKSDLGQAVEVTLDGGYIFAGATASFGAGYSDTYLVKTDADGNIQWEEYYGGVYDDRAGGVAVTSDGGYLLSGYTKSYGSGNFDIYLVKAGPLGEITWDTTFGGSLSEYGQGIFESYPGEYIMVGHTFSYSAGGSDLYALKISERNMLPVIDPVCDVLPDKFTLAQNYPNPFNAGTQIEFSLRTRSEVHLTIYNVLGQMVKQWQYGSLPAGVYREHWDGRTENGSEMASGIYFYRLESKQFVTTRKMVLLK